MDMKIRQEASPGSVFGMGNIVPAHWPLACYLTYSGHDSYSPILDLHRWVKAKDCTDIQVRIQAPLSIYL